MHGVSNASVPTAKKRSRTNKLTAVEEEIEDNEGDYVTITKSEWEIANEGIRLLQQGRCFYDNFVMETSNSQRDDLDSLCQTWSLGTPVERILSCLNNPAEQLFKLNGDELIANYEPLGVANQLARWTTYGRRTRGTRACRIRNKKVVRSLKKRLPWIIATSK